MEERNAYEIHGRMGSTDKEIQMEEKATASILICKVILNPMLGFSCRLQAS